MTSPSSWRPLWPRHQSAFSLVEVVIALGIVSFSLTTLLGMMPIGLSIFRDSVNATVQTDVLRQLTAQLQETPFDKLRDSTSMLYFSDQSTPVATNEEALLGITYTVATNTPLLAGPTGYTNSNLKTVVVSFYSRADRAKSPQTPSAQSVLFVAPGVR